MSLYPGASRSTQERKMSNAGEPPSGRALNFPLCLKMLVFYISCQADYSITINSSHLQTVTVFRELIYLPTSFYRSIQHIRYNDGHKDEMNISANVYSY